MEASACEQATSEFLGAGLMVVDLCPLNHDFLILYDSMFIV